MSYNNNIVRNYSIIVPCYLALENVAINCINIPARKAKVGIKTMLAFKIRSSLSMLLSNHCVIFLCLCRSKQFLKSIMLWFPSLLNRRDISSILIMAGMTVKIVVNMPTCCSVNEYLKSTMQIMNTTGAMYNDESKIILVSKLAPYLRHLGLLPWILTYYKDVYTNIDK